MAQKKMLTYSTYAGWPSLGPVQLSNNGTYLIYPLLNVPKGSRTMVIQSTQGVWKKEYPAKFQDFQFTSDSKYVIFKNDKDSLFMLRLGTDIVKHTPDVTAYFLQASVDGELLSYISSKSPASFVVKNLKTFKVKSFSNIRSWRFSNNGKALLLWGLNGGIPALQWVDMVTEQVFQVWKGHQIEDLVLDSRNQQLVFKKHDSIFFYNKGMKSAVCLFSNHSLNKYPNLILDKIDRFSKDGTHLFISLKTDEKTQPLNGTVEVWSFRDYKLQSEQQAAPDVKSCLASVNLSTKNVIFLQNEDDGISEINFPESKDASDTLALVVQRLRYSERWNTASKTTISLISTIDGARKILDLPPGVSISSYGKFLIYFDNARNSYFSYEISTGILRNLTQGLSVNWNSIERDDLPAGSNARGDMIWLKNDTSLLVCDRYDIWKLDPLNRKVPLNLTNGYGKRHHIVFHFTSTDNIKGGFIKADLFLCGFDINNKNNGFYSAQMNRAKDPKRLTMGKYIFCSKSGYVPQGSDFDPIKAKRSDLYIVRRMSATESPNYFSTRDFRTFTRLSNLYPEREYNWLTSELSKWTSLNGKELTGILYKPENFDSNKKYPIIIHFYERKSDGLNSFLKPEYISDGMNINIPTYVSQGYLVFCPDIFYQVGDPMQGTCDAVISAARYLSGLPFVDERKMGIQGGSFGGIQTNYLVTHSDIFSAAVTCSGKADWVSGYGSIVKPYGSAAQDIYESGQSRIGGSLWEKKDAYIKSSAIFQIDKITTPLLIMHGKQDPVCPFSNALEFFTGLRRMGKTAWMLAYPNSGHGLRGADMEDFSQRMGQFFDYYLKDKAPPKWMLDGIPLSKRGKTNGLELDTTGRNIGTNLLTVQEQDKVDSLMNSKIKK